MKKDNCVLIIAGPSGVGKTVVAESLVALEPKFTFLRSATTRARRGDVHDDEYIYLSEEEFLSAVGRGEFAEHMRYGGNLYGTPKSELNKAFQDGKIPLMVLDLEGVRSMAALREYSACSVYIYTDTDVILSRLKGRYFADGESEEKLRALEQRRARNEADFKNLPVYAHDIYRFINNDSTIDACRDQVFSAFCDFKNGQYPDTDNNNSVVNMLFNSVK